MKAVLMKNSVLWNTTLCSPVKVNSRFKEHIKLKTTKPRGFSPQANCTDRATSVLLVKLVPTFADRGCCVVSATNPSDRNFDSLDLEPILFHSSSSSNCSRG
jgi:hypothetical protein